MAFSFGKRGNPMAKKAMQLSRDQGISLKEAWAMVKSGKVGKVGKKRSSRRGSKRSRRGSKRSRRGSKRSRRSRRSRRSKRSAFGTPTRPGF